jgi:hypothetical protein
MGKTYLNKRATKILDGLTEGVDFDHAKKIDNRKGSVMAVHVERVNTIKGNPVFSVAHYYEQNGDLMADPDIEFLRNTLNGVNYYTPIFYKQDGLNISKEYVIMDDKGEIKGTYPKLIADCASFANQWMVNIEEQQNLKPKKGENENGMVMPSGCSEDTGEDRESDCLPL